MLILRALCLLWSLVLFVPAASLAGVPESGTPFAAVRGVVLDPSGAVVPGALVTLRLGGAVARETCTDHSGAFTFGQVGSGPATVTAALDGFRPATVSVSQDRARLLIRLRPLSVTEVVTVRGTRPDSVTATATKTDALLRDVPQAIAVVTREQIAEQGMQGLADVVRVVPGASMAQGEGNRDTPVLRGNSSTADLFVDGVRDDVQYFRDLYNVERVEALMGPNGMVFGRGGAGGVINRVTRQAGWNATREATLQAGSFDNRRATFDMGDAMSGRVAARVTGMYERSNSYREGVGLERMGLNPTAAFVLGDRTTVSAGYEYFHDDRTADRGVPSYLGRPVVTEPGAFFGSAELSTSRATVQALSGAVQHRLGGVNLRSRTRYADYDKFYQNVFPGAVGRGGTTVSVSAYNNGTRRRNLFHQTDVTLQVRTGRVVHTFALGGELGRQVTNNLRHTGYFGQGGLQTSVVLPMDRPVVSLPVTFRAGAADADNRGIATVAAVYGQDEIQLTRRLRSIVGLRYEAFLVTLHNNRNGTSLRGSDRLVSPRLGFVYKPFEPLSLYTSYSVAHVPRAGEQLASLSATNRALDPEEFRNYEVGAKWDSRRDLSVTAALYQLERRNVAVVDPADATRLMLVNGQRARGFEAAATGRIVKGWTLAGAYAYQDAAITRSQSATVHAGARLPHTPAHSVSLWNRCDWSARWGAGLGVVYRGATFASTDNAVVVPGFTRVDAAIFSTLGRRLSAQVNVENVFDARYFASAHSNNNILPGSPRAVRLSLNTRF